MPVFQQSAWSAQSLSRTYPHCLGRHPERPIVVFLLIRPEPDYTLHGDVFGVNETQEGDVSVTRLELAQVESMSILQTPQNKSADYVLTRL
jgi:hypothetical protein